MEMYKLLIVEDDPGIAQTLKQQLEKWGYEPRCIQDFCRVMEEFAAFAPQMVLLDISLPYRGGYYWCSEIRKQSNVPILFLSSASDNMNIVMAMQMGGDDFIAKPFDLHVLIAKIQAMLRRSYDLPLNPPLEHRSARLDTGDSALYYNEEKIPLTKNECRILQTLLENKGVTVSREKLMERLWQSDAFVDDNTLTVNVGRLRRKLEAAGLGDFISTKHGVGYMIG